jgi:hypothetical protein
MLSWLPHDEAKFYSQEENVLEFEGKSETLFKELESHFGFVGGSRKEYLDYF